MDAELERRLRERLDRDDIWDVMLRYARGLDRIDRELARSCYWDDTIEDHHQYVGDPDGFIEYANATSRAFSNTQHSITNHSCELAGNDAYCETYFIYVGTLPQPPHFMSSGRYVDHFQKRNGEWRIANRVTIVDATYGLPDTLLGKDLPPAYRDGEVNPARRDRDDVSYHRPPIPRRPRVKA
jgi:SnoaL-like protein